MNAVLKQVAGAGETHVSCAVRELLEETGVQLQTSKGVRA